ncbi:hypothetical protein K470DRAFT_269093 [Piedraia hortae CBS 480.64]|uniref:polynucleotide adenylyltransferase n=1 Tax=Piedraia hortae CBS 480.64 TaxID=1314780 RepID=A0A6A7C649_9PEZI|nr:hypothetical protein K470DRAFT_269093 [Piedraia hortae CBS 480.64]
MTDVVDGRRGQPDARPQMQAQTSSSVPSTPFRQPRDVRFHSRSPSPGQKLNHVSPRCADPAAKLVPRSAASDLCKFETTAEVGKRRMPYNQENEHAPPTPDTPPKTVLEPYEEDKLSGDMRELYDWLLPSRDSEERRAQLVQKLESMMNEEWPGHNIRVNMFGSSGNLLSSSESDVDICITTTKKSLETMHSIAELLARHGMERVVCRSSAKVPIVKCWDPDLKLACDLNVNNPLALENTRMIKTYVQLDERVRPLAKIIKHWSQMRILNDAAFGGTISSYTWTCMIISFLQRRSPPILPSLQKMEGHRLSADSPFADDVESLRGYGKNNKESLAQLLFQFFRHYGYEFDYSKEVVSVHEGRRVWRVEKGWQRERNSDKEAQRRLCVEEPFTLVRNLGNSADEYSWNGIHREIRRAFDLLADGQRLAECCEQYVFPPAEQPSGYFQRPTPRPAPTLRRSASQSGRPNYDAAAAKPHRGLSRNQSVQRTGNRRASSSASFGNQRAAVNISPPYLGPNTYDPVTSKLAKQYQLLQVQQDVLRSQYVQNAQTGGQNRRVSDLSAQHPRNGYVNGIGPRLDAAPTASWSQPGYLWHHPVSRHPPTTAPTRSGDGSVPIPLSPSLASAIPAQRQAHRSSITDSSAGRSGVRSHSQPGRVLPHPLAQQQQQQQQQGHVGHEVSGAIPTFGSNIHSTQLFSQSLQPAYPAMAALPATTAVVDTAIPKEYIGYYVGQSPSLGSQQFTSLPMHPHMTLRDPPTSRPRRVTPDLMPPTRIGRHESRSPSPLGHVRSYTADPRPAPRAPEPAVEVMVPLIVNGSTAPARFPVEPVVVTVDCPRDTHCPPIPSVGEQAPADLEGIKPETSANGGSDPSTARPPILSPVAEMQTPPPTHIDVRQESLLANGLKPKIAQGRSPLAPLDDVSSSRSSWHQMVPKGHRKSRSIVAPGRGLVQAMPENKSERKGG